jgi:hypothetical protein
MTGYASLGWLVAERFCIYELLATPPTDDAFVSTAALFPGAIVEAK